MSEKDEKIKDQQAAGEEPEANTGTDTQTENRQEAAREGSEGKGEGTVYDELESQEKNELLEDKDELIADLEQQLDEAKNAHLRKAAELENVKKRVKRERSQLYETARANALKEFLPINDDLHRTLKAFEDADVNENFLDGVRLIAEKFENVLQQYGVERIDEEMVPFNVDLHDAMMRQKPEDDSIGSDVVLQVLENGYRMGDRTIRHAKVIVSE